MFLLCPLLAWQELLVSGSWDRTCRVWDVFSSKGTVETLTHNHDVLAIAYRPDGRQLAAATLEGNIHLWDPEEGQLQVALETQDGCRPI